MPSIQSGEVKLFLMRVISKSTTEEMSRVKLGLFDKSERYIRLFIWHTKGHGGAPACG